MLQRPAVVAALAAVALAGCGGEPDGRDDPADQVRAVVAAYLGALEDGQWERACAMMTAAARGDVEDAAGRACARALASGAVLSDAELGTALRQVPGADVRIRDATATVGPLGDLPDALRLRRQDGRWRIDG